MTCLRFMPLQDADQAAAQALSLSRPRNCRARKGSTEAEYSGNSPCNARRIRRLEICQVMAKMEYAVLFKLVFVTEFVPPEADDRHSVPKAVEKGRGREGHRNGCAFENIVEAGPLTVCNRHPLHTLGRQSAQQSLI